MMNLQNDQSPATQETVDWNSVSRTRCDTLGAVKAPGSSSARSDARGAVEALGSLWLSGWEKPYSDEAEAVYSCVFVESGYEALTAQVIEYCGFGQTLALERILPYRRNDGTWFDKKRPLLPGYIFIRGEAVNYRLRRVNHVIRLLQYADGKCALRGSDRVFAERAFQTGGVIPKLLAHREGDFIRVDDPLLDQLNGKVRSVNKRNRLAEIDLDLVGTQNRVWLGLEIIN